LLTIAQFIRNLIKGDFCENDTAYDSLKIYLIYMFSILGFISLLWRKYKCIFNQFFTHGVTTDSHKSLLSKGHEQHQNSFPSDTLSLFFTDGLSYLFMRHR